MNATLFIALSIVGLLSASFFIWTIKSISRNHKVHMKNTEEIEELRRAHIQRHDKIDKDITEIRKELDSIFKIRVVNN